MSDLDDFSSEELLKEVKRRQELLAIDVCPYCRQSVQMHECRYAGKMEHFNVTVVDKGGRVMDSRISVRGSDSPIGHDGWRK